MNLQNVGFIDCNMTGSDAAYMLDLISTARDGKGFPPLHVNLSENRINDIGASKIAELIRCKEMASINAINLYGNQITQVGKDLINDAIKEKGRNLSISYQIDTRNWN